MESLGEYLKLQREKKSIRLEEIASITKIQLHNLELMEKGRWENLPPEPFIRGFILAYAKYVGLNGKDIIDRYQREIGDQTAEMDIPESAQQSAPTQHGYDKEPGEHLAPDQVVEKMGPPPIKMIAIGIGALLVFGLIARLTVFGKKVAEQAETQVVAQTQKPAEETSPTQPTTAEAPAQSTTQAQVAPPAPIPGTEPAAATQDRLIASQKEIPATETAAAVPPKDPAIQHEMTVSVPDKSWIKIVVDDDKPIQYTMKKDEKTTFSAKQKIKIVLGNSTGATVTHNGEATEGKVFQGTIRYWIYPQNARFPQDPPKPRTVSSEEKSETESTSQPASTSTSSDD